MARFGQKVNGRMVRDWDWDWDGLDEVDTVGLCVGQLVRLRWTRLWGLYVVTCKQVTRLLGVEIG